MNVMGVRDTETENKVALFDSVTMTAFGPVFDSADEADDFAEYAELHAARFLGELQPSDTDLRLWSAAQLEDAHTAWQEARAAEEAGR